MSDLLHALLALAALLAPLGVAWFIVARSERRRRTRWTPPDRRSKA